MLIMKKLLVLFVMVGCLTGCSCTRNGKYSFLYLEYKEEGEVKRTDCSNINELPTGLSTVCTNKNLKITIDRNSYTLSMKEGHLEKGYYRLKGKKMYLSKSKDGEYKYTGWLNYKDNKIYYGINETYVVLGKE